MGNRAQVWGTAHPPYRGGLQAAILDWAGTTVDYGSLAPVRALQSIFAGRNVAITDDEARRDMGLLMTVVDEIFGLFETRAEAAYFGEPVSQKEHALQAAYFAQKEGASDSLIVAALLHDVGHLLHHLPEDVAEHGTDTRHEDLGHFWLTRHFGPEVSEPVRLLVEAKRYLCRVEPEYLDRLSPASVQSLHLQGGPFDDLQAREFESQPYYCEAVRLRLWDDQAKIEGLRVPELEHYRRAIQAVVRTSSI